MERWLFGDYWGLFLIRGGWRCGGDGDGGGVGFLTDEGVWEECGREWSDEWGVCAGVVGTKIGELVVGGGGGMMGGGDGRACLWGGWEEAVVGWVSGWFDGVGGHGIQT